MFLFQIVAIVEFKRQAVGVARQVFLYDAAERAVANEESHGGVYGNLASLGQRTSVTRSRNSDGTLCILTSLMPRAVSIDWL